ncbi:hypothetical protein ASJ33_08010 [Dehalococcoides mccartyi]|jgi:PAS domain S-box-containing protein|uniref:PAS domain-containing sensor histidine kinase n=1 Tax=Dehalococcoides mccartyi TaxID=61435 RepID=UPI0004E076F9|nr:PAS domain S-box protein [Dehalococcoides mccartyi]AII58495.1 histidine kinase [Dehalococcoides mccartyi CG1]APH13082.1 hypothetical protein ASJ33_07895 [Dehalococcoides mccartyi]APH13103.1 hypothetical protein ASJ33_08010 [Dehalococcoides mccartyi]
MVKDISLKKNSLQNLVDMVLLDNAQDDVIVLDPDAVEIVYINKKAAQARGYEPEELIGTSLHILHTPDSVISLEKNWSKRIRILERKGFNIGTIVHVCKDGSIIISECLSRLIKIDGKKYVMATHKNISDDNNQIGTAERAAAYVNAQEQEREWISMELHDRVIQNMTSILHNLDSFYPKDTDTKNALKNISEQLSKTIQETRFLTKELYPSALERYGLIPMIKDELYKLEQEMPCEVDLSAPGKLIIPQYLSSTLYRVIHEALNNIKKHSKATKIRLKLDTQNNQIHLSITDNGIGLNTNLPDTKRPSGINIMRQRISIIGGDLVIKSSTKGTTLKVIANIPEEYCDELPKP